jgi:DNA-binding HxlR family transcriptional regulator
MTRRPERIFVRLNFSAYPLQASLGVLGRKWALLILMNIALGQAQRFNEMLRTTPGMSKRILAIRLNELERNGFISRAQQTRAYTKWQLAQKGADVLPVLLTLIHFGSKWNKPTDPSNERPDALGRDFDVTFLPGPRTKITDGPRRRPDRIGSPR